VQLPHQTTQIFERKTTREKREKISRGAKVGTSFATTTSSAIKAQNKKLTFGVGGE